MSTWDTALVLPSPTIILLSGISVRLNLKEVPPSYILLNVDCAFAKLMQMIRDRRNSGIFMAQWMISFFTLELMPSETRMQYTPLAN